MFRFHREQIFLVFVFLWACLSSRPGHPRARGRWGQSSPSTTPHTLAKRINKWHKQIAPVLPTAHVSRTELWQLNLHDRRPISARCANAERLYFKSSKFASCPANSTSILAYCCVWTRAWRSGHLYKSSQNTPGEQGESTPALIRAGESCFRRARRKKHKTCGRDGFLRWLSDRRKLAVHTGGDGEDLSATGTGRGWWELGWDSSKQH